MTRNQIVRNLLALLLLLGSWPTSLGAEEPPKQALDQQIREMSPNAFPADSAGEMRRMWPRHIQAQLRKANQASSAAWAEIADRQKWEAFRDSRLQKLKASLHSALPPSQTIRWRKTGQLEGNGFVIENLLIEGRPGDFITANLYRPQRIGESMPGIIVCHSHHRPKEQSELQDMGMTWARKGCLVIVPDMIGHGERRQHPFLGKSDYQGEYKWWRQDYYFRYDTGIQLHLAGESLIAWEVGDLSRCVDFLLQRPGIDAKRIVLLGAVAGGGDPAAVAAALDTRIAGAVPFNFGGPQPETPRLPEDIETTFGYAGSGSWESTRNLRLSASDGFLPWVIVGGIAPRNLIYAHEFRWDQERDPVWKRLRRIYGFYQRHDLLTGIKGYGDVKQTAATASHCTNIGRGHREKIHPWFQEWWDIRVGKDDEYSQPLPEAKLRCLTADASKALSPKSLVELLAPLGERHIQNQRQRIAKTSMPERRGVLGQAWARLLGLNAAARPPRVIRDKTEYNGPAGASVERVVLQTDEGIQVPLILFVPPADSAAASPLVVGVSQSGKRGFLKHRAGDISALLQAGVGVCLPDLRGTGETRAGDGRGKRSYDTGLSSSSLMLGGTALGSRLFDLRSVLHYLRQRAEFDPQRISLWGESFQGTNPAATDFQVPRRAGNRPLQSEPLGGLLVLLAATMEDDIHSIYANQALVGYQSVLESPYVYIPHDVVVPGALRAGDLADLAAAQAPRPLAFGPMVDGLNRRASKQRVRADYQVALQSYKQASAADNLSLEEQLTPARWFITQYGISRH